MPRKNKKSAAWPRSESTYRYWALLILSAVFIGVNEVLRFILMWRSWPAKHPDWLQLSEVLGIGLLNDLVSALFLMAALLWCSVLFSDSTRGRRLFTITWFVLLPLILFGILFIATAEVFFWNEFSARFNFIAVDYLVYTREVFGNIKQSYPLTTILSVIGGSAMAGCFVIHRFAKKHAEGLAGPWWVRIAVALSVSVFALGAQQFTAATADLLGDVQARELAGNGYREFVYAFRSNNLDYFRFYKTEAPDVVKKMVREAFAEAQSSAVFVEGSEHPLERQIKIPGPARRMNVVMVSIESLGADYVGVLGGKPGLTPNLDELAKQGMLFRQLYATGLRTVRGLEALTLSVPPTPGHAVPMRPDHAGFQTLGEVLKEQGYQSLYLYGGYSQFDNMQSFFGDNGYTVVDRTAIKPEQITHETIWGVADEDLFGLAVRELDARTEQGPVFAHIMTTSNHRPFTYPNGRIDIPSGSGRDGAVKYTDYAIGKFVQEARKHKWFSNTLFVFVADHTSNGRGHTDLPPENYRIPLIIYAPALLEQQNVDQVASQIDVAPTILGLLNASYTSQFFGQDILTEGVHHQRAFMANYLTVGYMEDGLIVELGPKSHVVVRRQQDGHIVPNDDPRASEVIEEAVSYYQMASAILSRRDLAGKTRVVTSPPATH